MEFDTPNIITITGTPYKKELYELAPDMYFTLIRIIDDLPKNRDWLDPDLERVVKGIIAKIQE